MTVLRGCDFPEDLYYLVPRHVWVRTLAPDGSLVRIGITAAGLKLAGGTIVAITPRHKNIGQSLTEGKAVAMLESNKYVGAIRAPFAGLLLQVNQAVVDDPELAMRDPYGDGWIAELRPEDWPNAAAGMLTGQQAMAAYEKLLEEENFSCDSGVGL